MGVRYRHLNPDACVWQEDVVQDRARIFILGPTPPPFHGVAVAIQMLLQSDLAKQFYTYHLDLADRRGIQHVNKPDFHDVVLFIRQWLKLVGMLISACPRVSYLVLSQSTIGFLRDSLLIWPAYLRGSHNVLAHLHGGNFREWFLGRSWCMKAYVKVVLRRVTRAIVLGESLKHQFQGLIDEERIAIVPNGIDWSSSDVGRCPSVWIPIPHSSSEYTKSFEGGSGASPSGPICSSPAKGCGVHIRWTMVACGRQKMGGRLHSSTKTRNVGVVQRAG